MRLTRPALIALAVAALAPFGGGARAEDYPLKIDAARFGVPPGRYAGDKDVATAKSNPSAKRGQYGPLQLDLTVKAEYPGGALVRVESRDEDDLRTTVTLPLLSTLKDQRPGTQLTGRDFGYTPYASIGARNGTLTVTILSDDGKFRRLAEPFVMRSVPLSSPATYVVVSLGNKLPGFDLPGDANDPSKVALRGGRVESAAFLSLEDLPDQWIGYQSADLVVLTTGGNPANFVGPLFASDAPQSTRARREALLEYVRRGGKLLISVGTNASALAQYPAFQAILPRALKTDPPTTSLPVLPVYAQVQGSTVNETLRPKSGAGGVTVANLGPPADPRARTLLPVIDDPNPGTPPWVAQAPYGLGRITLVAIDLDQSPFLDYGSRPAFWDYLLRQAGSDRAALAAPGNANNYADFYRESEAEWATALRTHVDTFDGVPVVSFGWVALFIALYTLLIGPVEYLVLKYVFKRLELTWITFPIIVVTVSVAAYFTAYAIKGKDLKLNKVDVIDIDLSGKRVYGHSFFTVFSPRIDAYTVGVEPRAEWATPNPSSAPLVTALTGSSGGSEGIISRGYTVNTSTDGRNLAVGTALDRVPIQVWSTKAFAGRWVGDLPAKPLITADLFHPPGDAKLVAGSFVADLPVASLDDAHLIYGGRAYILPNLTPGLRVEVPATGLKDDPNWFTAANSALPNLQNQGYQPYNPTPVAANAVSEVNFWGVLFHEKGRGGADLANAGLRHLDQSWRVGGGGKESPADEAILVGRVRATGGAEPLMTDPAGPSGTTLWLRETPGSGPRTPVPGTLRQETFVRVYVPIRPAAAK